MYANGLAIALAISITWLTLWPAALFVMDWFAYQNRVQACVQADCGVLCSRASTSDKSDPLREVKCVACIDTCEEQS